MYYLRKFFYYTFGRPKSALAVIFLLFIFGGIILPNTAMAAWWEQLIPGWSTWATVRDIGALAGIDVGGVVGGIAADLFAEFLRALSYVWLIIWYALADIVSKLADFIIRELLGKSITGNSAESAVFLTLWAVVRDWANMLIVIGLIGVAIATILSLEKYKAQKLLLPIIIVALLVNFSVLFVGLVIDASNIIMRDMTRGINTNTMVNGAWRVRNNAVSSIEGSNLDSAQKNLRVAIANAAFGWMFILLGASFGFLVLIFLQRYAILAILFIFSPLAFVLYVFPVDKAQELFKEWWQKFIKWSFAGLGAAFCLRLAMDMLNVLGAGQADSLDAMFYQFAIVLVILVVGLKISVKQSGPLAQAVIGIAKTAGIAIATGGTALAVKTLSGAGKLSGKGLMSLGSKGGWQSIGSGFKTGVGSMFKASTYKAAWRGAKAAPGVTMGGIRAAGRAAAATPQAIWDTGAAAWNTVYNAPYKGMWSKGLEYATQGIKAAPGTAWSGIQTGFSGVKTGAGSVADGAFYNMGAALRGTGMILSGRGRIKETMSNWVTKMGEVSGLLDQGTLSVEQQAVNKKKMEEPMKRYKAVQETQGTQALFDMRKNAQWPEERAAIDTVLAQNSALHLVGDKEKQQEAMNNAMDFGISGDEFTKNNADLVDAKKVQEFEARDAAISLAKNLTPVEARTRATLDAQASNFAKMKIENIENISDEDVAREAKETTARGAKFLQEAIKRKITDMISTDFDEVANLVVSSHNNYRSSAIKDSIKLNQNFAQFDPNIRAKVERENPGFTEDQVTEATLVGAAKKADGRSIREDLSTDAIDMTLIENIRVKTIQEADKYGGLSPKKVRAFKDLLPLIQGRINYYLSPAGKNDDLANMWKEKYEAIDYL